MNGLDLNGVGAAISSPSAYRTFAGFENAVWTLAVKLKAAIKVPCKKTLQNLFARCCNNDWAMPADAVIRALLDGALPKRFKRTAPTPEAVAQRTLAEEAVHLEVGVSLHCGSATSDFSQPQIDLIWAATKVRALYVSKYGTDPITPAAVAAYERRLLA